jgi:hypothetical protein
MGKTSRALMFVALAAAAYVPSGCGGSHGGAVSTGGDGSSASGQHVARTATSKIGNRPLATSDLRARAESVCRRLNVELGAVRIGQTTLPNIAKIAHERGVLEEAAQEQLRMLTPPASLEAAWHQLLGYRELLVEAALKLAHFAQAKDRLEISRLVSSVPQAEHKLQTIAAHHRFRFCGTVGN